MEVKLSAVGCIEDVQGKLITFHANSLGLRGENYRGVFISELS